MDPGGKGRGLMFSGDREAVPTRQDAIVGGLDAAIRGVGRQLGPQPAVPSRPRLAEGQRCRLVHAPQRLAGLAVQVGSVVTVTDHPLLDGAPSTDVWVRVRSAYNSRANTVVERFLVVPRSWLLVEVDDGSSWTRAREGRWARVSAPRLHAAPRRRHAPISGGAARAATRTA